MRQRAKAVYLATTADTKGPELDFVRHQMNLHGVATVTVDLSTRRWQPALALDVSAAEVARHHPAGAAAVFCGKRGQAVSAMALAFRHFMLTRSDVAGVLGLGGSGGTALVTPAMQALPIGLPKLMVSTMASGDTAPYVGGSDIAMLYSVTDVSGLNRISRRILSNAASQMCGAVLFAPDDFSADKPAIGLTMFGVTTPCVQRVSAALSQRYDCLVFHATGSGGDAMENLAASGALDGVMDLTLTEIADCLFGGVLPCRASRLDAIAATRIPWVGAPGALDMVNFAARDRIPEACRSRQLLAHNAQVTLMRTTPEENAQMGRWIAKKLNRCKGEIRFLIPQGGFSVLDTPDQPFWNPDADRAFIRSLEQYLLQTPRRRLIKLDCAINDPAFATAAVHHFNQITYQGADRETHATQCID